MPHPDSKWYCWKQRMWEKAEGNYWIPNVPLALNTRNNVSKRWRGCVLFYLPQVFFSEMMSVVNHSEGFRPWFQFFLCLSVVTLRQKVISPPTVSKLWNAYWHCGGLQWKEDFFFFWFFLWAIFQINGKLLNRVSSCISLKLSHLTFCHWKCISEFLNQMNYSLKFEYWKSYYTIFEKS